MSKRWLDPGALFIAVLVWKLLLFLVSAQPIPANDSFFYDGPVVNLLLHGRYVNPSLALAFPISGTQVFSAYPPLYQLVLLGWMKLFGTSALAAMALHLGLFTIYAVLLLAVLKELETPAGCARLGMIFLFVLTFHDRPDSLAHVFGFTALYAWICSRRPLGARGLSNRRSRWNWLMALAIILALGTSLQIGAVYCLLVWTAAIAAWLLAKDPLPFAPLLSTVLVPVTLIAVVAGAFPQLWNGFLEHAHQTPSLTGWRRPQVGEFLKIIRTVPGSLAAISLLCWVWLRPPRSEPAELPFRLVTLACGLATVAVVAGCLLILTPNMVVIAAYLQPIMVAGSLAVCARSVSNPSWLRAANGLFVCLALVGSLRAIGISTWGLLCAQDCGYRDAIQRVRQEAASAMPGQTVVFSAAYLYEAARHDQVHWIHSDWLAKAQGAEAMPERTLLEVKPAKLVLTQFDYYRRYAPLLIALRSQKQAVDFQIVNCARIPPPDSFPSVQRVLQHISWAPVIVTLAYKH